MFPSDETSSVPDIDTPIGINDDKIDEAIQNFVAFLEVVDAVNFNLLSITRAVSVCRINDDDRK